MAETSHPPHLIRPDSSTAPSAFIPFCAYKSRLGIEGTPVWHPNISFPLCSSFQLTILEGQLCYKLEMNTKSARGKMNELMFLLDYHEDLSIQVSIESEEGTDPLLFNLDAVESVHKNQAAKVQIATLSSHKDFGEGSYKMSGVKRMTAKDDFLKMPLNERTCEAEPYEDCRTKKLLEKCKCVPWEMSRIIIRLGFSLERGICTPEGRDCIEKYSNETFWCNMSCVGIHADLQRVEEDKADQDWMEEYEERYPEEFEKDMKTNSMQSIPEHLKDIQEEIQMLKIQNKKKLLTKEEKANQRKISKLVKEYTKFKKDNLPIFKFKLLKKSSFYGELFLFLSNISDVLR